MIGFDEAERSLAILGGQIANVVLPNHKAGRLKLIRKRASGVAVTFEAALEDAKAYVKIFAGSDHGLNAFNREQRALDGFHKLMVPKLLLVAEPERLLVTRFVAGRTLDKVVTSDNLPNTVEQLGKWLGILSNSAPRRPSESNWTHYLENYERGFEDAVLEERSEILDKAQISYYAICHNDNALSNYILDENDVLYGIDFEDSRFKPEGWDLITAALAFFRRFPAELPKISATLLNGYLITAEDSSLNMDFGQVISVVAIARAVSNA